MAINVESLRASLSAYLQLISNQRDATADTINQHGEMVRKVDAVLEEVQSKERGIVTSRALSDEGKRLDLAKLATSTAPRFAFLGKQLHHIEEHSREMKTTLFTINPPAHLGDDKVLKYLYGREIRDRFAGLTQQEKDVAFLQAAGGAATDPDDVQAQANRDAVLWAIQETPGGPMLTAELVQRSLDERARRTNPETVARLHQVTLLHESLSGLRDSVANWLHGLGGDQQTIFKALGGEEPIAASTSARTMVHA